ncbi:MAG: hypothetical protein LBH38_03295 [Holosporales bacterium]|jgi:hypothetical protein|nr:hypothetical protein [Holosporales bacterium]
MTPVKPAVVARKLYASWHALSARTHHLSARLPAYALTLTGITPKTLKVEIPYTWPTEYTISTIFQNTFVLLCSGRTISLEVPDIFWNTSALTQEESAELHGFSWLSILVTIGDIPQRLLARTLVMHWITHFAKISPLAWRPDVLGKRLSAWINAYNFVAKTADTTFKHIFLKSLAKQYRYLRRLTALDTVHLLDLHAAKGALCATIALYGGAIDFLTKAMADFSRALEKCASFDEGYPWELLEALRLLIDIRTALLWAHRSSTEALDDAIQRIAERLRLLQQADGSLSLLGSGCIPRKDLVALALDRAQLPYLHTPVTLSEPRFLPIKTAKHMVLVEKEAFSPSLKKTFAPLNIEYSHQTERIILGTHMYVVNDTFHGTSYVRTMSARVLPYLEHAQDKTPYWIRGTARWHLEGEPFTLKRHLLLDIEEDILRGEDTFSSPPGFSTSLLFTFLDKGNFLLQETLLSCRLSETKKWSFCFSSGICAELRSGPFILMEGIPIATKVLALYYPQDEETSVLRWGVHVS